MGFERYHRSVLPDEIITAFYQRLIDCDRERMSYPADPPQTAEEHLQGVRNGGPWWLIVFDGQMAGCFYLNDLTGKSGRCHFAFLPSPPGLRAVGRVPFPVALGRFVMASTLHDQYPDGEYMVDTLIGLTPSWNKGAVGLIKKCGAVILGAIPGAYYSYDDDINDDGVISYFTRDRVPLAWATGRGE